jgi:hypothetical protein
MKKIIKLKTTTFYIKLIPIVSHYMQEVKAKLNNKKRCDTTFHFPLIYFFTSQSSPSFSLLCLYFKLHKNKNMLEENDKRMTMRKDQGIKKKNPTRSHPTSHVHLIPPTF